MNIVNDKITELVKYIKKEFPEGCGTGFKGDEKCPLRKTKCGTVDDDICNMLNAIGSRV